MPRTADHVLFGRADLAGDATDAAHRPPMVERDGPRPHRGGSPLRPTSVAVFLDPWEPGLWQPTRQRDPRRLLPLARPRCVAPRRAEAQDDAGRYDGQPEPSRRRDP